MKIWNKEKLYKVPKSWPGKEFQEPGVKSLYYEGLPYKSKPTEVYAYYGVPEGKMPEGGCPAVVLVHGGGGTAFAQYVKWWNQHGYAAIAMDLEGHLPDQTKQTQDRPAVGRPGPSQDKMWDDIDKPVDEQWFYHCIAQVVLAHSLIRSFPEVNPEKTGIVGISWGGIITCLAIGVDDRFKFAVPVYGCVALADSDGTFGDGLKRKTPEHLKRIMELWEGSGYLSKSKVPILWINGTNDIHFPLDSWQKSINMVKGQTMQRTEIRMPHGHGGFISAEAVMFADGIIKGNTELPVIGKIKHNGNQVLLQAKCVKRIVKAELCYTTDQGKHSDRLWKTIPANIYDETISASLPESFTAFFFNVTSEDNLMLSSKYIEFTK